MRAQSSVFIAFAALAAACGSDATNSKNYGDPPDAAAFNPGSGGPGDGYGSGAGVDGGAAFVCPDEFKRCAQAFTLPYSGETSVELRGDYRGPESWVTGDAMTHVGPSWKASVNVPLWRGRW